MEILGELEKEEIVDTRIKTTWKQVINKKLIEESQNLNILPILIVFLDGKHGKRESYRKYCEGPWENVSRPTFFKKINDLVKLGFLENEANGKGKDAYCLSEKAIALLNKYQKSYKNTLPELTNLMLISPLYRDRFNNL